MGIFVEQTIRNYLKIKIAILLLKLILIHFLYLDHKEYVKFAELKKSGLARGGSLLLFFLPLLNCRQLYCLDYL